VVIGDSTNDVRPHQLLALMISDNPDVEEDEPEVLFTSSMHGNETVGFILLLRLAEELLGHYDPTSADPYSRRLTDLVDSLEIWLNPLANPDGTYFEDDNDVSGARRSFVHPDGTSASMDPNRNFPDPDDGDHPDGNPWWRETVAMMDFAAAHSFVLSANFHGGAEVVNYPWDTWRRRHTDDAWFAALRRAYADATHAASAAPPWNDSTYMRDLLNGITNGYDWYPVSGGRQDYMTFWHGSRETTIEVSHVKTPPASELPRFWDYNREALLGYLEAALGGARGVVTEDEGRPLDAVVEVVAHDIVEDSPWAYTDPDVGDYHRMLLPGRYDLYFRTDGYLTDAARVNVTAGAAVRFDVVLEPDQGLVASLHGTVRVHTTGEPFAGAVVDIVHPPSGQAMTGTDGSYAFQPMPEGAYVIRVSAPGYAPVEAIQRLRAPDSTLDVDLLLKLTLNDRGWRPMVRGGG